MKRDAAGERHTHQALRHAFRYAGRVVYCSQPLKVTGRASSEASELVKAKSPSPVSDSFGSYRIRGVLGKGGMAKVYLAERTPGLGARRWCAVKIPEPKYRDTAEFRRMFQTEAALAARICHPHVCCALETGDWLGTPFFTMELLRGRSLLAIRKVVKPTDASRQHALRVARLIADACEGLQAIHDFGASDAIPPRIVHRDISPDNLFLTTDGFVKILDFGLAQTALAEDENQTDLLRGKISYIAPELLHREVATSKSDVWGLGVVAWELLVGRPLFNEATDYETLAAVREQHINAPSELVPGLPSALDAVILRALQRDPSRRFDSAAEFGRALWKFMVEQGEIVHHADLAEWLRGLFPPESDIVASLCAVDVSDMTEYACSQPSSGVCRPASKQRVEEAQTAFLQSAKCPKAEDTSGMRDLLNAVVDRLRETFVRIRTLIATELAPRLHVLAILDRLRIALPTARVTPLLSHGQTNSKNLKR